MTFEHPNRRYASNVGRLIVIGGLPGTGKTTLAQAVVTRLSAVYLRVDAVEAPLFTAGIDVGPLVYQIVRELAHSNLALGADVVVDLVNPIPITRQMWRKLATRVQVPLTVFECVIPSESEHRRRVEERVPDLPDQVLPNWNDVVNREYTPWDEARDGSRVTIDMTDSDDGVRRALTFLESETRSSYKSTQ